MLWLVLMAIGAIFLLLSYPRMDLLAGAKEMGTMRLKVVSSTSSSSSTRSRKRRSERGFFEDKIRGGKKQLLDSPRRGGASGK